MRPVFLGAPPRGLELPCCAWICFGFAVEAFLQNVSPTETVKKWPLNLSLATE